MKKIHGLLMMKAVLAIYNCMYQWMARHC